MVIWGWAELSWIPGGGGNLGRFGHAEVNIV